jgi:hypothetical protein
MAIQDLLLKQMEGFLQALGELFDARKHFQWEKALGIISENRDQPLWKAMKEGTVFSDKSKKEALEFQLKLRFHEIEVLKATGKKTDNMPQELIACIEKFAAAFPDMFFYELENMKTRLYEETGTK